MSDTPHPVITLHWYRHMEVNFTVTVEYLDFGATKTFMTGTTLDQAHEWAISMVRANDEWGKAP